MTREEAERLVRVIYNLAHGNVTRAHAADELLGIFGTPAGEPTTAEAKLEPMPAEPARDGKKFVSGKQVLEHYGATGEPARDVTESVCGTCGGTTRVPLDWLYHPRASSLCPDCNGTGRRPTKERA